MARGIAVVAGATGLVGRQVVAQLAAGGDWPEIRALVRRPYASPPPSPVVPVVVDFDQAEPRLPLIGVTHLFSCLGTTMAQAGSRAAFRRVDLEIPLTIARSARAAGTQHYLLVSAVAASSSSRMFYSRVKAELEEAVIALGFRSVTIARPSFLVGERPHPRLGEQIASVALRIMPSRWRPVRDRQVAAALIAAAITDAPGVRYIENSALLQA
jgi:uncharacterized protein YbjT (DUF2867 family)